MSKNAIITLCIGETDYTHIESMRLYANKFSLDFIIIGQKRIEFNNIYFEKYQMGDFFDLYDRILYLDADVIITPQARNIFEVYADEDTFYAFNENLNDDVKTMSRDFVVDEFAEKISWDKINGRYQYFNAGVMLIPCKFKQVLDYKMASQVPNILNWIPDQTILNYLVVYHNIKFGNISYSFNRMNLGLPDDKNERYNADFIHYAGPDTINKGLKTDIIKQDFNYFYS